MDNELKNKLERFALKHKLVFEEKSEVGFGRPCVGFTKGEGYINFNPTVRPDFDLVFPDDDYYESPENVPDAYHKHDCMAVLVHDGDYDKALHQLGLWVDDVEAKGGKVVEFSTGATGIQALFSGLIDYAFRFEK
jgi:hypothetical protein